MTEIQVILHTINGDVITSFGPDCLEYALDLIRIYTKDGKSFSVKQ